MDNVSKIPDIQGKIKHCTISLSAGKWYVSFQVEQDVPTPVLQSTRSVGIDVGIAKFVTLSDGTQKMPKSPYRKYEKKAFDRAQQALKESQVFRKLEKAKRQNTVTACGVCQRSCRVF